MQIALIIRRALVGLLATLMMAAFMVAPAGAATEVVTGTATTSGGNGTTTQDFVYSSPGVLGSGTMHFDFVLIAEGGGFRFEGTGILTRSDGATLTGTETGTTSLSMFPFPVVSHFTVTSGTGALAGVSGEIVLTGASHGPGTVGDVFTMSGTLTTPARVPTDKEECKDGGWRNVVDDQGEPFPNQGQCVAFVMPAR
jgi:hypothetical protein